MPIVRGTRVVLILAAKGGLAGDIGRVSSRKKNGWLRVTIARTGKTISVRNGVSRVGVKVVTMPNFATDKEEDVEKEPETVVEARAVDEWFTTRCWPPPVSISSNEIRDVFNKLKVENLNLGRTIQQLQLEKKAEVGKLQLTCNELMLEHNALRGELEWTQKWLVQVEGRLKTANAALRRRAADDEKAAAGQATIDMDEAPLVSSNGM